jgi:XTP/dITP diphosphohydrolase
VRHSLVVATSNRGKLEELRALLAGLPLDVLSLADVMKTPITIVEDGKTFAENAIKKARTVAEATMMLALADDSGLEVDALHGAPGVYSARFAHERATDAENNAALLSALDKLVAPADGGLPRTYKARFRCALALVDPYSNDGAPRVVEGVCEGKVTRTPRGSGGFGYDPLFVVDGLDRTMAELTEAEKNKLSHRARAFAGVHPLLASTLRDRNLQIAAICT